MITSADLEKLIASDESDRFELTESLTDSDKFCEAICAFANDLAGHQRSGYLVIGADKTGRPTGALITDQLLQNLASHRDSGRIIPQPVMSVEKIPLGGASVAVVEVQPSTLPPVRFKGVTWVRVGPRRGRATIEEERRLTERRVLVARTWDARPCIGAGLDDVSIELFRLEYLPQAVSREVLAENQRTNQEQLGALRLYDPRHNCPTNAAILLLGKDPISYCPGAYVQFVRYSGPSQGSDVLEEQRIDGDLLNVMRELDRLAKRLAEARPRRGADLKDATTYRYPPIALHEIFMNAVVHRNYDESTTPVIINEYCDRLEIQNPGSLFGDLTRAQFPRGVAYRNPVLAEACKTLGFVNRFGRGIAKAQEEMKQNGSPPIEFEIGENHFAAILRERL